MAPFTLLPKGDSSADFREVLSNTIQGTSSFDPDCIAIEIHHRGLAVPAVFMLECFKPLTTLSHAALQAFLPVLIACFGRPRAESMLRFLESRENIELLIKSIERTARR